MPHERVRWRRDGNSLSTYITWKLKSFEEGDFDDHLG